MTKLEETRELEDIAISEIGDIARKMSIFKIALADVVNVPLILLDYLEDIEERLDRIAERQLEAKEV